MHRSGQDKLSEASRATDALHVQPPLQLGAGAFASPLVPSSRPDDPAGRRYRLAAIALVGAALLAVGIVGIALLVREQRAGTLTRVGIEPRVQVRAETPSELQMRLASSGAVARPSNTVTPLVPPPAPPPPETAAPTQPAPKAQAASAAVQSSAQAQPVVASKPERSTRRGRAERKHRAAATEPALPEAPTRAQVIAAMRKVTPAATACFKGTPGKSVVAFSVVGKTGRVVGAHGTGSAGSCIARVVRRARFPKFAKPRFEISYPFAL